MSWVKCLLLLLILGICSVIALAGDAYVSTASIFELGVSARILGMGGAFIGLADDGAAVFYNPAGLPHIEQPILSSLCTRPFGAYSYISLGTAAGGWGGYLLLLDSDVLEERDLYGNPIGSFRYTSGGLIFGYGQSFRNFSLGVQLKVYTLLAPLQALGFSLSPAALFHQGNFTIGMVWQNLLNTPIYYSDAHTESWTRDVVLGISWRQGSTLYCLDFTENLFTRGDISCMRFGFEYTGFSPLIVRAGVNRDWSSLGLSVTWNDLSLDFACLLHYAMPASYWLSLSYHLPSNTIPSILRNFLGLF